MAKTYEQVVQELDAKIPRDCISSREGGGRSKLSYLEGHYVIDRLNKVLGQGNWAYSAEANLVHTDTANNSVHYLAKVRLVVDLPGEPERKRVTTEFVDYGYGDGKDKYSIGKAHELAVKESVTDGIKRCAKNLGMSMGLALYNKTQENVEDAPAEKAVAQGPAPRRDVTGHIPEKKSLVTGAVPSRDRDTVNKAITANSRVVIAKKLKTVDELKADMRAKYGTDTTASLTDEQAKELLATLKEMANG